MKYNKFRRTRATAGRRCATAPRRQDRATNRGVTLMEVILAIAILGGSLAVLGEMVRVGARASRSAQLLSSAQLLADSLTAEMAAGAAAPESTQGVIEQYGGTSWSYTVEVQQVEQQGLLGILITVQDSLDTSNRPTSYTLVRWMIDPEVELDLEIAAAEAEAASAAAAGTEDAAATEDSAAGGSR